MRIGSLKEFRIWQLARRFADAVSELLKRPAFRRDIKLSGQLNESTISIVSNSAEGFGQDSDRTFANYLSIARGSNNEAISQLGIALGRGYLTDQEFADLEELSDEMGRSMTSLIGYLQREDREHRRKRPRPTTRTNDHRQTTNDE